MLLIFRQELTASFFGLFLLSASELDFQSQDFPPSSVGTNNP